MLDMKEIDFSFRPGTYWPESQNIEQRFTKIKGQARRELSRAILEESGLSYLDPFLMLEKLPKKERQYWGSIHPSLMGGEYLPDQPRGSVEIARISLRSVTFDQIAIYAKRTTKSISYKVFDEYGTKYKQPFYRRKSILSLLELIGFIDQTEHPEDSYTGGLVFSHYNARSDNETFDEDFVTVKSVFYPDLEKYYKMAIKNWIEEHRRSEQAGDK